MPDQTPWTRREWAVLAGLLLLAAGVRAWQIGHTVVTSRDSVHYIHLAWQLGRHPPEEWPAVLSTAMFPPGYPLTILATSAILAPVGTDEPDRMRLAAQLASAIASVLLVIPVYLLGREVLGPQAGFGAALLVQCLPATGRLFGDGLSEATFLLFAVTGLYAACRGFRPDSRSVGPFAVAGIAGGLAYLVRPEGLLVPAAAGLVLLVGQVVPRWRRPGRAVLASGFVLTTGALLVAAPLVLATGRLTVKASATKLWQSAEHLPMTAGPPLAVWWTGENSADARGGWAAQALTLELLRGSAYVGLPLALLGFWARRERWRSPAPWVLAAASVPILILLWRVAQQWGYTSDRHLVLPLTCGAIWVAPGMTALAARLPRLPAQAWLWGLLLLAGAGLTRTLEPLHPHRVGFVQAGRWLAEHADPDDAIDDPFGWSRYYAGRAFTDERPASSATRYVVLDRSGDKHGHLVALPGMEALATTGREVYRWEGRAGKQRMAVAVYAVSR